MASSFKNVIINDTGYLTLPVGTTAQRPTASAGMLRYSSTNSAPELYNNGITTWENSAITWTTPAGSLGTLPDRSVTNYTSPFKVAATGPGTITYTLAKGSLPPGMSLASATGIISGDPADLAVGQNGTGTLNFPFIVRANSSTGGYKDRQFAITLLGGGGLPKTIADGADAVAVSGYLTGANTSFNYFIDSWYQSAGSGSPCPFFNTTYSGTFAYHTGHSGNSSQWPFHIVVQATSNPNGKVLNRIQWIKHANACGNCNIFGTNQFITQNNYNDTTLYTYLGRVWVGGNSSATDGTVMVDYFNPDNLGFKWYLIQVVDAGTTRLPYPLNSTLQGWAMYSLTLDKV